MLYLPYFPFCFSGIPHLFEISFVTKSVHRPPEPIMTICDKFSFCSHILKWLSLANGFIVIYFVENFRFTHKKTSVYPGSITFRFFLKCKNFYFVIIIELYGSESTRGLNNSDSSFFVILSVKINQSLNVDITHTISICK